MILTGRTPKKTPPLSQMLREMARPSPQQIAAAFHVSRSTAYRWITADEAPRAVMLALYWMSHAGRHEINQVDFERANRNADMVRALQRELDSTRREFARVLAAADFGCANDVISEPVAWAIEAERRKRPLKLVSA